MEQVQQSFANVRGALMAAAVREKINCVVLYSADGINHTAISGETDLSAPGIQSCILTLIEWLPLDFAPLLEKSLERVRRNSSQLVGGIAVPQELLRE